MIKFIKEIQRQFKTTTDSQIQQTTTKFKGELNFIGVVLSAASLKTFVGKNSHLERKPYKGKKSTTSSKLFKYISTLGSSFGPHVHTTLHRFNTIKIQVFKRLFKFFIPDLSYVQYLLLDKALDLMHVFLVAQRITIVFNLHWCT